MRAARIAVCLLLAAASPASAASLLEKNFWLSGPNYDGVLPACHDSRVTSYIAHRFAKKEYKYWNSNLTIQQIDREHEIAYRPWGEAYIPRRFCEARALTSDGYYHDVSYAIGEDLGFVGVSWGVEWCVTGLDRNLAYAPACKMAQP